MFEWAAIVCSGTFFGAALYISLVQHPAVLEVGDKFAARFFPPMYGRAARMQAALAILGSISGVIAWATDAGWSWLVGSCLLFAVVPFTLLVIKPVNDRLLDPGLDPEAATTRALLERWGRLHWLRGAASGLAFLLFSVS